PGADPAAPAGAPAGVRAAPVDRHRALRPTARPRVADGPARHRGGGRPARGSASAPGRDARVGGMSAPQPRLRPTDPATLVVAGLAAAATGWLLISHFYGDLPRTTWFPVVVLAGVAVVE